VKCHSKRLASRGAAWKSGEGLEASSEASFTVFRDSEWLVGLKMGVALAYECA
jgi:hypothetical protein